MLLENNDFNILVLDDETLIIDVVKGYLIDIPCHIYKAHSVKEAWDFYNKTNIDLVIADVKLSGEDSGLDFAEKLLKLQYTIPIILLTGHDDKEIILKALRIGITDYLTKPIIKTIFITRVKEAILKRKVHLAQDKIIESLHELLCVPKENNLAKMSLKDRIIYIQELVLVA